VQERVTKVPGRKVRWGTKEAPFAPLEKRRGRKGKGGSSRKRDPKGKRQEKCRIIIWSDRRVGKLTANNAQDSDLEKMGTYFHLAKVISCQWKKAGSKKEADKRK